MNIIIKSNGGRFGGLTWIEAAFHVLPYSVLDRAHKLTCSDLGLYLSWGDEAYHGPAPSGGSGGGGELRDKMTAH